MPNRNSCTKPRSPFLWCTQYELNEQSGKAHVNTGCKPTTQDAHIMPFACLMNNGLLPSCPG